MMVFPPRVVILLGLDHARIDPEEPLPSQTVVKLRELRPLARAVRPQFRAKDTQHRFPALRSWTGTLLCHTIHRAILLVVLQFRPACFVLLASFRQTVTRRHFRALHSLRAGRMHFFLRYYTLVLLSIRFPAQTERDLDRMFVVRRFVEVLQRFHALVLRATRRVAMVQHRLEKHLALWIVFASIIGMVASAREHDLDRLLYLIEIGGGGWQHHGRLITVVRLISLVLRFVMMSTGNRYLLHGDQIVVISVDQRILELGLDHLEAGRVVRMRDDLHCKRANVTEHGEENVGAAGTSSILIPALRHPQKINSREEIVEGTR